MVNDDQRTRLPLSGLRVLDVSDLLCEGTGRILADLGADVVKIEPSTGAQSRRRGVLDGDTSLSFAVANANKRSTILDLDTSEGRTAFLAMVSGADLVIAGGPGGQELVGDVHPDELRAVNPRLVILQVSYFGQTGPYKDWVATNDVLAALTGQLAKSGLPGRVPLLPPEHLGDASASAHAAWTAMMALWKSSRTGEGETIDFSVFEAVAMSLDPAFGISGSARGAASDLPRGRPDARHLYPIFRCADGWARICLLSARQWTNMLEWMGRPPELADPKYSVLRERHAAADMINSHLAEFFAGRTRECIVEESVQYGVPAAGVLEPSEVFSTPHYLARGTFTDVGVGNSRTAKAPRGYFAIDGDYVGYRTEAPALGAHTTDRGELLPRIRRSVEQAGKVSARPFAGIRVLDMGVIVAGAEAGRLFSDWGADVIKVENRTFLDGNRQSVGPDTVTQSFARGHRNKRSLGIDLRSERGREIFLDLVRKSDVLLSNFKPGTLESLGLGYDVLADVNPRIVMADSSAFGRTGPWSRRMGYGPLVRASTGLSWLWSYPEDSDGFSDAITIYPDHAAGRFVAIAVIALLMRREITGHGGTASIAQVDILLNQMADRLMMEALHPGSLTVAGNLRDGDAPRGVYPCAGDDDWCVVDVQGDKQFRVLAEVIGAHEWLTDDSFGSPQLRLRNRAVIECRVTEWTTGRPARTVMTELQDRGVPCAMMLRGSEFDSDPQLASRNFLHVQPQPQFDYALVAQNGEAVFSGIGPPDFGPAPIHGEHSVEVCSQVLSMSPSDIAELVESGVLEVPGVAVATGLPAGNEIDNLRSDRMK